jgi:hypothetical protein
MSQHLWNTQIFVDGIVIVLGIVFAAFAHFIRRRAKRTTFRNYFCSWSDTPFMPEVSMSEAESRLAESRARFEQNRDWR